MIRVLRLAETDDLTWQRGLLTEEVCLGGNLLIVFSESKRCWQDCDCSCQPTECSVADEACFVRR